MMGVRNIFVVSYFCFFLACPRSSGYLISSSAAQYHCKNLQNAALTVLQDLIGSGYTTQFVSPAQVKGFSGSGTCSSTTNFCSKIDTYLGILGDQGYFLSRVMLGRVTDNGYSDVSSYFGGDVVEVYSHTGGSGSGGGFQFHCGTQEIGGCGGGGGGGFNTGSYVVTEVGGGGGCNIGSASLNYGCRQGAGTSPGATGISSPASCQTQSSSASWSSTLSNFKAKLVQCARNKQLTVQGGGGGGGGTSSKAWLGYGCSFAISVNGSPIVNSPSSSYVQGPLMSQACVFISCLAT